MSTMLAGAYLGLLSLLWAALVAGLGAWSRRWRLERRGDGDGALPSLSVCVPARNEAGRVGDCVRAVLALDYPNLQLVVVDDRSEDGTADEARAAAGDDPRFLLVSGAEPPPGWAGKPWACARAAGESKGELLLFLDADVLIAPWAARAAAARLVQDRLALLSLFGTWRLESFWEEVVIPVVGWFIRGVVDVDAVNDPKSPQAFANGQFILARRDAYERMGGHETVRAEVLEDVRLAEAFKAHAMPCGLFHAPGAFTVRLYDSLASIVRGYAKNLYEGMGRRPVLAFGAVLFIFTGTVLPFLLFPALLATRLALGWQLGGWIWVAWTGLLCALILLHRVRLERMDGRSGWQALTHPIGNLIFVWILLRSMFGVEVTWKGRRFVDGKAA